MKLNNLFNEGWEELGIEDPNIPNVPSLEDLRHKIWNKLRLRSPDNYHRTELPEFKRPGKPDILVVVIPYRPTEPQAKAAQARDPGDNELLRSAMHLIHEAALVVKQNGWHLVIPNSTRRFEVSGGLGEIDNEEMMVMIYCSPVRGTKLPQPGDAPDPNNPNYDDGYGAGGDLLDF